MLQLGRDSADYLHAAVKHCRLHHGGTATLHKSPMTKDFGRPPFSAWQRGKIFEVMPSCSGKRLRNTKSQTEGDVKHISTARRW